MVKYLFPHRFKSVGIALMSLGFGIILILFFTKTELNIPFLKIYDSQMPMMNSNNQHFFLFGNEDVSNELTGILMIIGGLLATFSKEKKEDEYITKIRLESLVWATFINYGVLLLLILTIFGIDFLYVMEVNMCTFLLLAFFRFNYLLLKTKKELANG